MISFITLVVIPMVVFACGPGTGPLGKTATFTYTLIPPPIYTTAPSPSNGQLDASFAAYIVKNDVNSAMDAVLAQNNLPLNDIDKVDVTYDVPITPITTLACDQAGTDGLFELVNGLVFYKCSNQSSTPFSTTQTVTVYSNQLVYQSQWQTLGEEIQNQLETRRGTIFLGLALVVS